MKDRYLHLSNQQLVQLTPSKYKTTSKRASEQRMQHNSPLTLHLIDSLSFDFSIVASPSTPIRSQKAGATTNVVLIDEHANENGHKVEKSEV
jgi:hypothetical protein